MRRRRAALCAALGVLLALQVIGFGAPAIIEARAAGPVELHIGFLESIDSLNPFRAENDPAYVWMGLEYDFLFSLDQDGNYVPNLALSASCDATCRNWTYQIRRGVLWHDGTAMTADDIAFTFNYNIQNFWQLWAFEPYVNRIVQCSGGQTTNCGAVITSPWNVTIYFDRPFVPGKALFVPILQKKQWQGISASQAQGHFDNPTPIGTGPFMADANIFDQWSTGQPLLLHKNPNYHPVGSHTGAPVIDNLYLQQFADENTLVSALRAGTIDLAKLTPAGYGALGGVANVERQEGLPVTHYSLEIGFTQLYSTSVNGKLNPARWDEKVRRALAMATNKDYIIKTIYQGKGVRGTSLMSPVTPEWFYDPTKDPGVNLTFNEAAANALLDAAGYTTRTPTSGIPDPGLRSAARDISFTNTNGDYVTVPAGTSLVFTIATRLEFSQEQQTANYLKQQWARLGVQINIKSELEAALSADVYSAAVEGYIWYWSGDPDPNYLLSVESGYTLDGWNDNYWDNATYNQLYVDHLAAQDPAVRQQIVHDAQRLHYESAVYITYVFVFGEWAYRTDHFSGWGDWNAHPYRQMDAYWGANPLFLELVPTSMVGNPPTKPVIAGSAAITTFVNTVVGFSGTSSDPDPGQTLSWSWSWGDGQVTINQHDTSVTQDSASHMWTTPGTYAVTLTVSDGQHTVTSDPVQVTVVQPTTPLGWINGTVKDSASQAVSGAAVTTNPGSYHGASAADGTYRIVVPIGTYSATATAPLYSPQTLSNLVVTANGTAWANFTLAANVAWIAGTVTNSAGGGPIGSASVYVTSAGGQQRATSSGADGKYNVSLEPGTYSMNVSASGFDPEVRTGITVTSGVTTVENFVLNPVGVSTPGLSSLALAVIISVVLLAAAVAVAVLLMRRRKKKAEPAPIELPPQAPP